MSAELLQPQVTLEARREAPLGKTSHRDVASAPAHQLISVGMSTPIRPDNARVTSGIATVASARRRRLAIACGVSVVAIVIAHVLDVTAWTHIKDPAVYDRDWGRMLRSAGYLPTWFIVAIALWAHDRPPVGTASHPHDAERGWRLNRGRALAMALAPTLGGALAEVLKLVVRRLRPGDTSPAYVFRAFADGPFSNRGMGMPSSHVLVAMSAATVLARLFPRVRWMWYAMAAGCAYTRVAANAHYLSDTVVAAALGWFVGDAVTRWCANAKPPEARAPGGE